MIEREKNARILVVEDEPGLRMVVQSELQRTGYEVDALNSGTDAVVRLSKERYDLVVLDVTLPGKSGLEVLQYIRDKRMPTRVITMTGMEGLSVAIKAVKLGADDYIPKPFDAEYLLTSIKMVLRQRR